MTNLSLLYTDVNTHYSSQTIASFLLPLAFNRWARFALKVSVEDVTVYYNCGKYESVPVKREPQELVFDSASTLYVGQAGPIIKGALAVSTPISLITGVHTARHYIIHYNFNETTISLFVFCSITIIYKKPSTTI